MDPLLVIFLRSLLIFAFAIYGLDWSAKSAYWLTIAHDVVSLTFLEVA